MTNKTDYRYLRHIDLPQIGFAGQAKIASASIALVGLGGLGCPSSLYLAAAGVGTLTLIDDDHVDENNLQRQILFTQAEIGQPKVVAGAARLHALNPTINIHAQQTRLDKKNAAALLKDADIILDGSDNFETRHFLNCYCVANAKTLVSASVDGFSGQVGVFAPHLSKQHACYHCLFPEDAPESMVKTCPEAGVFGPAVGITGTLQAAETLKALLGLHPAHSTFFTTFNSLSMQFTHLNVPRNPHCPTCANRL